MRPVLALLTAFLCTGCGTRSGEPDAASVAAQNYDGAIEQTSRPAQPIVRTNKQKRFIKEVLNPGCVELDALLDGCAEYQTYVDEATQLQKSAKKALGPDDPQVFRPAHYLFKKACNCNDTVHATVAGKQLAVLQARLFGRDASDVKATVAELGDIYARQGKPRPTVDEVLSAQDLDTN